MSVKVVLSSAGDVEIVANAVTWSNGWLGEGVGSLFLFADEERKNCIAEFREWVGVKKEG